jgi:hypothetical protein
MRPRPGYTVEEYGHDVERAGSRNRRVARAAERRIDEQVRFLGGAMADRGRRAVFWQRVPTGRLWAVSDDARPGDVHHVRVSGRARRPVPPPTTATLTVSDGSVQAPAVMPARGVLLFRNSGTGPHMVGLAKILDGRTVADVIAYLDAILDYSGSEGPPAASPIDESVYGAPTMAVDPGGAMSLGYSLPPGQYVAICVTLDRATGTFHIQHGEATNVTLT